MSSGARQAQSRELGLPSPLRGHIHPSWRHHPEGCLPSGLSRGEEPSALSWMLSTWQAKESPT